MKKLINTFLFLLISIFAIGQNGLVINNQATLFKIEQEKDTIDFIVVDTLLNTIKPIFLWCQGSLPIPLFFEIENSEFYFSGGGISNFDYKEITKSYHLVVISMPKTPVSALKTNLNHKYQYVPDTSKPDNFSLEYIEADYLENYVNRAISVLNFLNDQKWVDKSKLVISGHSQGTKTATKIAVKTKIVTHLGLFSANPFGRIDQYIREARLNAQLGNITWEKADSIINQTYQFFEKSNNPDSLSSNPYLKAWKTFSEAYYDDWLQLDIPIYLSYGTEDQISSLCDIVPLFFISENKKT